MGSSGYTQYLCEVGHYDSADCYDGKITLCAHCDGKIVWQNMVDQTNGSFCDVPEAWLKTAEPEDIAAMTNEEYQEKITCKGCE